MKTQIAAIEFGTSKIVTMIAQNSGMDRLDIIGSGTVPYDGYSNGEKGRLDIIGELIYQTVAQRIPMMNDALLIRLFLSLNSMGIFIFYRRLSPPIRIS